MNKRGIIITNDYRSNANGDGIIVYKDGYYMNQIRKHLLYFDMMDWPRNNMFAMSLRDDKERERQERDIQLLQQENILSRTQINVSSLSTSNFGADKFKYALQLGAFYSKNRNQNEEWAISQPSKNLVLPDEQSIKQQTLQVSLIKCLPTPKPDTEIEEILNFKANRGDELESLRYALDGLYLDIINSKDIPRSKNHAIQEIERTLADLETVTKESGIKYYLSSFDVSLNFNAFNLALGGAIGMAGLTYGLPVVGTMFTSLLSFIKFKVDLIQKPKTIPNKLKDYAYLNEVMRHL